MIVQNTTSRFIAVCLATSIHAVIGWALFLASPAGVPVSSKSDGDIDNVFVVELVPLHRAGVSRPMSGEPTIEHAEARSMAVPPRAPLGKQDDPSSHDASAPALGRGPSTDGSALSARIEARSMADLPSSEVLAYRARLQSHLARFRLYPPGAQNAGDQGVVFVHFVMDREGRVVDAWLETTSGVAEIDREALAAITRAQPLPPLPAGWPERLDISLPVSFKLG